jgi:sarcosine oxidase, subunit gamma
VTGEAFARVPVGAQLDLRLDPGEAGRLPFALPLEPNTVTDVGDGAAALWLGPDEWLIVGDAGSLGGLAEAIGHALTGVHHSVVDVSANRVTLELSGGDRFDLFSAGCGLDLHPRAWSAGQCAQTLLARVPVILWERTDTTRVLVRPSFADYLADWLAAQAVI